MIRFLAVLAFLVVAAGQSPAQQAFLQISSIRARPETLTCIGPGATAVVRVQIYLAGLPSNVKNASATAQLAAYSAHPSINKLDIREPNKEFALTDSPTLVDFEVNCTGDTLPGEIALAAVISQAPQGVLIKDSVAEPIVRLRIVKSK